MVHLFAFVLVHLRDASSEDARAIVWAACRNGLEYDRVIITTHSAHGA